MGRTILAEERVQKHIETLYEGDPWNIGLIIGQQTAQRDYALHVARTPRADVEEDKEPALSTLDIVDEHWVALHAKQVARMLPGGLDVIGIFAMAQPQMMKNSHSKLRQVLFSVHKALSRTQLLMPTTEEAVTDRVVLCICPVTRKFTCRTFDVADHKSAARPAEWKSQSFVDRWLHLETHQCLDVSIPVSVEGLSQSLNKQIQTGLVSFCESLWTSTATVDGELLPEDRLLDITQTFKTQHGKKSKKSHEDTEAGKQTYCIQFLTHLTQNNNVLEPQLFPCGARLHIRGTQCARAYVHNKATVNEGVKALKTDIIRSLISRCDLLCEDFLQSEEDQDPKVLYETPLRIFGPLVGTPLSFCDYTFQDETAKDSVERFRDLMDLQVEEEDLETTQERIPEEEDLIKPEKDSSTDSLQSQTGSTRSGSSWTTIGLALGGAVAALAAAVSYLYLEDTIP